MYPLLSFPLLPILAICIPTPPILPPSTLFLSLSCSSIFFSLHPSLPRSTTFRFLSPLSKCGSDLKARITNPWPIPSFVFFFSPTPSLYLPLIFSKGVRWRRSRGCFLFVCLFFLLVHTDQARPQANNAKQGREGKDTFWAIKKTGSWAKPKATHEVLI